MSALIRRASSAPRMLRLTECEHCGVHHAGEYCRCSSCDGEGSTYRYVTHGLDPADTECVEEVCRSCLGSGAEREGRSLHAIEAAAVRTAHEIRVGHRDDTVRELRDFDAAVWNSRLPAESKSLLLQWLEVVEDAVRTSVATSDEKDALAVEMVRLGRQAAEIDRSQP